MDHQQQPPPPDGGGVSAAAGSSSSQKKTLEAQHYRKMEDLMSSWDTRVQRQVAQFTRLAENVSLLDLRLCATVSKLERVQEQNEQAEKRQQEVDASLEQIERHQKALLEALHDIEEKLTPQQQQLHSSSSTAPPPEHPLPEAVARLTTLLDNSHLGISHLTDSVNAVQEVLYPGDLQELIHLLNAQQSSLSLLEVQTQQLKDSLGVLEK